jgi:EAL domain-containing protein (putative c-di-GMP-specific phosphodiesterase class I)
LLIVADVRSFSSARKQGTVGKCAHARRRVVGEEGWFMSESSNRRNPANAVALERKSGTRPRAQAVPEARDGRYAAIPGKRMARPPPKRPGRQGTARLGERLDGALESMWMAFQPIVHASTRSLFGYEALLRSEEPALPDPGALLDAAERLGRLYDVGRVVREKASAPIRLAPPTLLLFVNLHPVELNDEALFAPGAPLTAIAARVVLEITERASLDAVFDVASRVARLREHGFRIAIDDLGAGYSGLSTFTRLTPDFVKLDLSLVRDIHKTPMKQKLVQFMTRLCKDLNITVIAEGIEATAERDTVIELGCELLQGYLLGKPARPFPKAQW